MVLLIDNYDSFTFNLRDYILQAGQDCVVVRNDEMPFRSLTDMTFDSIVISPGPKTPAEAGLTNQVIAHYASRLPILGICLGHQALGLHFGARLIRAPRPMHGKTSLINCTPHPIFESLPAHIEVMRYHSLILDQIADTALETIASTASGEVMAIAHPHLPLVGLQFHPESILTAVGMPLIQNWFRFIS